MDKLSLFLSGLFGVAMILLIAPSVLHLNRGKILQNAAIWLAIATGLALFYQHFGPGKAVDTLAPTAIVQPPASPDQDDTSDENPPAPEDPASTGEHGYTPPGEE